MITQQFILVICIFGAVAMVAFLLSRVAFGERDEKLRSRLAADQPAHGAPAPGDKGIKPLLEKFGQAAAQPFMPSREKQSSLRRDLNRAGIYSQQAIKVLTGAKVIFLCGGLIGGYAVGTASHMMLLGISVGGLIGYLIPKLWLSRKINANQKQLNYGLPDTLDLMVVCVESGLAIDAAMQRVGQEMALAHPAISRELAVTHMETRVGVSRSDALRNMGLRTGNDALKSLASMLAQAERFGTSIGQALRIHADALRVQRQHAAEELAAKASVKMSFPLVLFIFPATFIVLAGPIVIGLKKAGMM